jgi:C4-dicarboxylate-specific signal transduction histidine kinase
LKKKRERLEAGGRELEKKVKERTAQLSRINESLLEEIEQKRKNEESLKAVTTEIERQLTERT